MTQTNHAQTFIDPTAQLTAWTWSTGWADSPQVRSTAPFLRFESRPMRDGNDVRALLKAALLVLPSVLAAQEQAIPSIDSPLLLELVVGPTLMGDQGYLAAPLGLSASLSWVGFNQTKGYRLGLVQTSTSSSGAAPPASAERGILYNRYAAALTVERIRFQVRGRRVITTGYGFGVGSLGYDVKQLPSPDGRSIRSVYDWAPAVAASADVAYRFRPSRDPGFARPIDLFVGVRSVAMLGVRTVTATPPSTGPIPTTRGIGHINQIGIGFRFGRFNKFLTGAPDDEDSWPLRDRARHAVRVPPAVASVVGRTQPARTH